MIFNKMEIEPFIVTEIRQVRALASPARSQIMDLLRQGGEKSVTELARGIGFSPPATHYQVQRLVEVGLAIRTGKRRVGPRSESLYRAVSSKIKIPAQPESPEFMDALLAFTMTSIRNLEREIVAAHKATSSPQHPADVKMLGRRGYIQPEDLSRLQELLSNALDLVNPAAHQPGDLPITLRMFVVQLPSP